VLISDGESLGFRHELTRQAIEESISATRLVELHRLVLAALAEVGRVDPARLADHAERAGLGAETRRYAELAAAEAERVGALREPSLQLGRALRSDQGLDGASRFELPEESLRSRPLASPIAEVTCKSAGNRRFSIQADLLQ
jgi:hypothetical protein